MHHHRQPQARLADMHDLELIDAAHGGCRDALHTVIARYRRFARLKARQYFVVGADADDVEQEALIGLFRAVRDFRPEHDTSFRTFAEVCITRQVLNAVKAANRQKHQALNQYVPLAGSPVVDEVIDLRHPGDDLAERLVAAERFRVMRDRLADVLSELEVQVLTLYVEGQTYEQIADRLDRSTKAVDNALQRVKRKLEIHLADRAEHDRAEDLAQPA